MPDMSAAQQGTGQPVIDVRRSSRRRRTVSAYQDGDRIVVLIPAQFTKAQEAHWVTKMVGRLRSRETVGRGRRAGQNDSGLQARCRELSTRYLDGQAAPASVRWVASMRTRWASCTPQDRTIRVSARLGSVPTWVLDYVLVHELAHLREPGHDAAFWSLVSRYPRSERARGYLDGLSDAALLPIEPDLADDVDQPATAGALDSSRQAYDAELF